METILNVIENKMGTFSKGNKRIAEYILSEYKTVGFMTATKVAKATNVSESTVVRFAVNIGLDGYPHLQRELKELAKTKLTAKQRVDVTNEIICDKKILTQILHTDMDRIKKTIELDNDDEFNEIVQSILKSNKLYIVCGRSSYILGEFFYYYLKMMFNEVVLIKAVSVHSVYEQMIGIKEEHTVFGISYPRYLNSTLKGLEYGKSKGANVVGLTDKKSSPVCELADHTLFASSDMTSFVDSTIAPMSILNALIIAIGRERSEQISNRFETLEEFWNEYEVFNSKGVSSGE